jgi:tRNA threonylcarbamoyladenosine modification (KEOPS) complex  Pcc1 subunit
VTPLAIRSTLILEVGFPDRADKLYRTLYPEFSRTGSKEARVSVRAEGSSLVLQMEASTIASLRALLNSYIRWVSTSLDIVTIKGD